jgi:hypothetical protein
MRPQCRSHRQHASRTLEPGAASNSVDRIDLVKCPLPFIYGSFYLAFVTEVHWQRADGNKLQRAWSTSTKKHGQTSSKQMVKHLPTTIATNVKQTCKIRQTKWSNSNKTSGLIRQRQVVNIVNVNVKLVKQLSTIVKTHVKIVQHNCKTSSNKWHALSNTSGVNRQTHCKTSSTT